MGAYGEGALHHNTPQENNDTSAAVSVDGSNCVSSMMRSIVTSVKSTFGRLSSRPNSNQNNYTSRVVMIRARAYSTAFLLSYSWYIAIIVLGIGGVPAPLALIYLTNVFGPLQGVSHHVVHFYHHSILAFTLTIF